MFLGRITMGLFGKTVPKTAGMIGSVRLMLPELFQTISTTDFTLFILQKILELCAQVQHILPSFSCFLDVGISTG